ncbi:hypothetical protein G6F22_019816 [Rhizopus arrhizus]|nr:hypothetical protein G6F22_019816 [Rhizopus arrhizus]
MGLRPGPGVQHRVVADQDAVVLGDVGGVHEYALADAGADAAQRQGQPGRCAQKVEEVGHGDRLIQAGHRLALPDEGRPHGTPASISSSKAAKKPWAAAIGMIFMTVR